MAFMEEIHFIENPETRDLVDRGPTAQSSASEQNSERGRQSITRSVFQLSCLILVCLYISHFIPTRTQGWTAPHALVQHYTRNVARQEAASLTSTTAAATTSPTASTSSSAAVQNVFQVSTPVVQPQGTINEESGDSSANATEPGTEAAGEACRVTLMEFSFASSFGKPFVGNYTPPSCIDNANTVIMNFTVTSKGVQFDRLALMYLGDTEVFRTSTAEPKLNGILWVYEKDMSQYMSMWKSPQKLIFDLANIIDADITGVYNTTLKATFFNAEGSMTPADMIIPISTRQGVNASAASVFSIPTMNATNTITFPRNANRAVFSVSSCGQGTEEFWWSNALQSDINTFAGGVIPGFSPFREVQVYIDGQLAGVQWPFPVIFTGGVVPGLWSPVVGIDAFDLQEYEIDITPWLGLLCDGNEHTFSIQFGALFDDGKTTATIGAPNATSWSVTGKIFVWLDETNSITTGTIPTVTSGQPKIAVSQSHTQNSTGANETLAYTISVTRSISISSTITTKAGINPCSWTQSLMHSDDVSWSAFGNNQINLISTTGVDTSTGANPYSKTYSYPLYANTTSFTTPDGSVSITALVNRSKIITTSLSSIYPSGLQAFAADPDTASLVSSLTSTTLMTTQNGTAILFQGQTANSSFTFGSTEQDIRLGGVSGSGTMGDESDIELYFRSVAAVNGTLTTNLERKAGKMTTDSLGGTGVEDVGAIGWLGVELAVGRSPGLQKFGVVNSDALLG